MTVTRYKPVCDVVVATVTAYNAAHPDGDYVRATDYDALAARVAELEKDLTLHKVLETYARDVSAWDWSDNDADCVADIEQMGKALDLLDQHRRVKAALSDADGGSQS